MFSESIAPSVCRITADRMGKEFPDRIVVRGTNWVGDTVMSLPAAKELRRIFPSSHITFWVPAGLVPLVASSGIPDDVIGFDATMGGPLKRPFLMSRKLAAGTFGMAVLLQNAFESAFTAWLARIPMRVGYPTDLRGPLLSLKVPLTAEIKQKHQVFYYLGLTDFLEANYLGRHGSRTGLPDCSITLKEDELTKAGEVLASAGVHRGRPLFCLCPGSVNSEAKRWPADLFASLADLLIQRVYGQVVFLGAPSEKPLIESIISAMNARGGVNLAGQSDMITSMALMHLSDLVISNDTGSAHLAVAAGARILTIFGPTSVGATAPYGRNTYLIQGEAPCAPCRHFRCPKPDHPCMRGIGPEIVLEKVRGILSDRITDRPETT